MKQNVIFNKINKIYSDAYDGDPHCRHGINAWNNACKTVAAELRSEGLEVSAKEAESWIEKE